MTDRLIWSATIDKSTKCTFLEKQTSFISALHYNNCMFIAHHLMTLGHQFSKKLPSHINSTFVDLVPKIRRLGSESFIRQLSKQKAQMSEYLKAANGGEFAYFQNLDFF